MIGYPLIPKLGSYELAGRPVVPPCAIEVALLDGEHWLKVVVLDPPENSRSAGYVHLGFALYGGLIFPGDVPCQAMFRWPNDLAEISR